MVINPKWAKGRTSAHQIRTGPGNPRWDSTQGPVLPRRPSFGSPSRRARDCARPARFYIDSDSVGVPRTHHEQVRRDCSIFATPAEHVVVTSRDVPSFNASTNLWLTSFGMIL